jgi:hypothetical protein
VTRPEPPAPVLDPSRYDAHEVRVWRGDERARVHYFGHEAAVTFEIVRLGPCVAKVASAEGHVPVLTSITTIGPSNRRQGAATRMLATLPRPLRTSPRTPDGHALLAHHPDIGDFE